MSWYLWRRSKQNPFRAVSPRPVRSRSFIPSLFQLEDRLAPTANLGISNLPVDPSQQVGTAAAAHQVIFFESNHPWPTIRCSARGWRLEQRP
jgi:hypothetical protein